MTAEDTTTDEQVKQQLRSGLETLSSCCQAQDTSWPSSELLQSVEKSAKLLVEKVRKKPPEPIWKGFKILDGRRGSLRPANRVDILVKRALLLLKKGGESELDKLARQGDASGQKLLRDIERLRNGLSNAKAIDWAQHEKALAQFSRAHSVELSCKQTAPLEVRCYARTLELLIDDYRHEPLRRESRPLLEWVARIGHPEAKSLLAYDYAAACDVQRKEKALREEQELRQREKQRRRTKKHRTKG